MEKRPNWLPQLLQITPWTNARFEELYTIFTDNFIITRPLYDGVEVFYFPEYEDGKIKLFWHLVQKEDKDLKERVPDFRRCERLNWLRPVLDNIGDPQILHWDYQEADGSIKTYIWLKDLDYLIVLKKMKYSRRLITAFFVEYEGTKKGLMNKYAKRIKKEDSD